MKYPTVNSKEELGRCFPPQAVDVVYDFLQGCKVVRLVFCPNEDGPAGTLYMTDGPYTIQLNPFNNPYFVLETFLHERAHLEVELHDPGGSTHGEEFQRTYCALMREHLHLFPEPLADVITRYLAILPTNRPFANSLYKELNYKTDNYPDYLDDLLRLDDLPCGATFITFSIYETGGYYTTLVKADRVNEKWSCVSVMKKRPYLLRGDEVVIRMR